MAEEEPNKPEETGKEGETKTEDLSSLRNDVNTLAENINNITEQLGSIQESLQKQPEETSEEPEEKVEEWEYEDIPKKTEELAEKKAEEIWEKKEAEKKEKEEAQRAKDQAIEKYIDDQVTNLEKEGRIKPVDDPDDESNPDAIRRKQMFGRAFHLETSNLTKVLDDLDTMAELGMEYDYKKNKFFKKKPEAPGKKVPVGSSSNKTQGTTSGPISQEEASKTSLEDLAKKVQ